LAERAFIHRSNFADEPLRVEQARLRKVRNGFAIVYLSEREGVAANARMADQRDAEERFGVEGANDEHRTVVILARTIKLISNIDTNGAPPDLASVLERAVGGFVDLLLVAAQRSKSYSIDRQWWT
jgi:hypothetical protein